ncbi:MAG: hypothetical protein KGL39_39245 [Patescibacteria group bacterium]|nr:hypothetical protein [Patescibacteria group bacterium]
MTATNRYMNTSGWQFTPSGGSAVTLTGITGASYDEGISTKKEGADFDGFPTVSVRDYADPKITLETLDAMAFYQILAGAKGVLTGNIRDAYNGVTVGGGGKSITMSNCQIEGRNFNAPYRDYARQQLVFGAISSDGQTHPVAIAAL